MYMCVPNVYSVRMYVRVISNSRLYEKCGLILLSGAIGRERLR